MTLLSHPMGLELTFHPKNQCSKAKNEVIFLSFSNRLGHLAWSDPKAKPTPFSDRAQAQFFK